MGDIWIHAQSEWMLVKLLRQRVQWPECVVVPLHFACWSAAEWLATRHTVGIQGCSADDAEKKGGSIVVVVAMVGGEMAQPALRPLCW